MIEPTASDVAQKLWDAYLNVSNNTMNMDIVHKAYHDYNEGLRQFGITPIPSGFQYRCMFCTGIAKYRVMTSYGISNACQKCSDIHSLHPFTS